MSNYVSKDLENLKRQYVKSKSELSKVEKRFEEYLDQLETELYDKYIGAPLEKANEINLPIKDVMKIRKTGREELEKDLSLARRRKSKELEIAKKKKNIFKLEMEINSKKETSSEATN